MTVVPERLLPSSPEWFFAGHQHLQRYELASRFAADRAVLDWACGVGYGSYVLAGAGAQHVLGADIADDALAYAGAHYRRPNLKFERADGMAPPPVADAFDLAVSFETIEHVPNPAKMLANLALSLRAGGLLLISAPNALQHSRHPTTPIWNEFHVSEPVFDELVDWVAPRFEILREWEQTPFTDPFAGQAAAAAARLSQPVGYAWCRVLNALERAARGIAGKNLPPFGPLESGWPARWAEIVPLLPERHALAHTFILLCRKR